MSGMSNTPHVPMIPTGEKTSWNAMINSRNFDNINIDSNAILLDVLRDSAGMLGVKRGCDLGTCGCCAVLIDGVPKLSCLTLAAETKGKEITTVEGLADGAHLHPIQKTFSECGGSQCGFCTPGFLVVISALLHENNNPNDKEIKDAIEGNLCRCTGYQQIIESVHAAADILNSNEGVEDNTIAKVDPHPGIDRVQE
ncbi:MAG: 4-hydroxybenzoyl-CoA reductase subunit gamma [Methanobacteriota archaeon]|nr:MAG: 4-hydroxybenzoyl-CoA reductase subunit gamma [Euryarchaeota archaeon]